MGDGIEPITGSVLEDWSATAAWVAERFDVVITDDDWVGLVYRSTDGALTTRIKVLRRVALRRSYVTILADVLPATELEPALVMAINNRLPIGALEEERGRLLLRAQLPQDNLDRNQLCEVVDHVARQAQFMQMRAAGIDKDATAFDHYTE